MKRVFIDMDNVLVDFQSGLDQVSEEVKAEYAGRLDEIPGLFAKMKPMEGAVEAVHELKKHYDLFILSTAPWKNPSAWSDKVEWVTKYLEGMVPYISSSDVHDYKYNIRIIPEDVFLSEDDDQYEKMEEGTVIAHYESMEELVADGWILD